MPSAVVEMPHHPRQFPEGLCQSLSSEESVLGSSASLLSNTPRNVKGESQWGV